MSRHTASCIGCRSPSLGDHEREKIRAAAVATIHTAGELTERHFDRAAEVIQRGLRQRESQARLEVLRPDRRSAEITLRTARHEAGHSVVALDAGNEIGAVNIDTDCTATCGISDHWQTTAVVDLAGVSAEQGRGCPRESVRRPLLEFVIRRVRTGSPGGCDACHAMRVIQGANLGASDAGLIETFDDMHRAAFRRVTGRLWPAIERVADALVARGHLSGAEVAELVSLGDQ